jgi:hypothetical protein
MDLWPESTKFQTPGLEPSYVMCNDLKKSACVYVAQELLYFQVGLLPRLTDKTPRNETRGSRQTPRSLSAAMTQVQSVHI